MPTDFKKIFADKTKYPDTMKLVLGDGVEVTLAELRDYDASVGQALSKELETQRKALEVEQTKVATATQNVAQMWANLEEQRKALAAQMSQNTPQPTSNNPLQKYEEDDVFRPVMQHIHGIESKTETALKDVTSKLDQVVKSIAQMGSTYMGDKARMDFNSLPADDPVRPKDLNLDTLYKFAVERSIYDRNNLPDLREAYSRLTADARHQHELAEARKDERNKVESEIREGAMLPRPVSGLPPVPEGFKPPINMADAFSRAGSDRELWKNINIASGLLQ